jgi:hypothetical protein
MSQIFERVRTINQSLIDQSAEKVWSYLTDWAGSRRQRAGGMGQLTVAKISLEGEIDQIPRTRVLEFGAFGTVRETLLRQDDSAMHLYYIIEGTGPLGIRNYLATTDVDPVGPDRCQVTITARFDLERGGDVVKAKGLIDFAHNDAVIGAIRRYYAISAHSEG